MKDLLNEPLRNGVYKKKEFHGRGTKVVNMGELFAHSRLFAIPMKRVELNPSEQSRYSLARGDLIFARRSLVAEGAGKCSIVLEVDEPTVFESSIIRARPNPKKAEPLYLYYFFDSPEGRYRLSTIRRHVAVAGITGGDLKELKVKIPPLTEQRAIVDVLGALDDKIELNRRMSETLEQIARELYRAWFVDFSTGPAARHGNTGRLPYGWTHGSLVDVSELSGEAWQARSAPSEVEYLDLSNVKWGRILGTVRYTWDEAPSRARRILRSGDTVVGTVRPGNGSYALVSREGLTGSTGFAVLRPKSPTTRALTYLAATDASNIERLAHLADGAAYPAVRPPVVHESPLTVPDQDSLLTFSNAVDPLLDRLAICEAESQTLSAIRDALLPKLISGEIRVPQAERLVSEVV